MCGHFWEILAIKFWNVVELRAVRQVVYELARRVQLPAPRLLRGCVDPAVRLHQLGKTLIVVVVQDGLLVGPVRVLL